MSRTSRPGTISGVCQHSSWPSWHGRLASRTAHSDAVADDVVAAGATAAGKFLLRWRGEADPRHVQAIDTYWICTAEHGLNASTFTARVAASTGADAAAALSSAVGTLSGRLHGGAPAHVIPMIDEVAAMGDPERYVEERWSAVIASWASGTGSTARRIRAHACSGTRLRSSVRLVSRQPKALEEAALAALEARHPERCSRRTSSTGPRSCSTWRTFPPS